MMDEVCLSSDPDILSLSRNGDAVALKALLNDTSENLVDINCKGSRKGHRGWTSLHLACYFGHHEVARILLTVRAIFRFEFFTVNNNMKRCVSIVT